MTGLTLLLIAAAALIAWWLAEAVINYRKTAPGAFENLSLWFIIRVELAHAPKIMWRRIRNYFLPK